MNWPLLALAIPLSALGFTALGFAMAWWIDSTQGYHAVMSVALIPLWMLSGAMFPPTGSRWLATLTALDPMTYAVSAIRRGFHGTALPLNLVPPRSSTLTDLAIVVGFAIVALAAAVALCRRRA
jgi:ABC-2 type transport system permease protein